MRNLCGYFKYHKPCLYKTRAFKLKYNKDIYDHFYLAHFQKSCMSLFIKEMNKTIRVW